MIGRGAGEGRKTVNYWSEKEMLEVTKINT